MLLRRSLPMWPQRPVWRALFTVLPLTAHPADLEAKIAGMTEAEKDKREMLTKNLV
jgi:hypothetical protein